MSHESPSFFELTDLDAVADEYDLDTGSLADALAAHQRSVEELPGVENLVYEWRKQYEDPLLARTETAYYLVVPRSVWDEFGDALGLDESMLDAVIEVHRRAVSAATDAATTPAEEAAYVALDRTL